eukprot:CAMPEP_0201529642 /NCGR_PEP_ID=MMETSP0161_2-20130828/42356_1 /ASSEMBLY_ACC=CAM_ASM_000251 /TAXON_ID=180227 /ORGANISM="Neoparamoeba aestuarina, Strain SoJaBio B1-5/56/2" /LENGTH=201 /DNA_ID=CAMNT_0047931557 /DNA_START=847 /DNA_END=1449 /DNA_ORIENTATION=-
MAVIGGLTNTSVHRMQKTWDGIHEDMKNLFEHMQNVFSHRASFTTYRALLQGTSPPCLPYLGLCLADLTFLDDGNKEEDDSLHNLKKWEMMGRVINQFYKCQKPSYSDIFDPGEGDFIESLKTYEFLEEKQCHHYSTFLEPKDSEKATQLMLTNYEQAQSKINSLQEELEKVKKELEARNKEGEEKKGDEREEGKEKEKES